MIDGLFTITHLIRSVNVERSTGLTLAIRAGAQPRLRQNGAVVRPPVCRDQPDDEVQPCRLEQPVQVDHQAAFCLMVLAFENLMDLSESPRAAGRSTCADFEFRGSATRIRTWNLPVNSRPLYR